MAEGNVTLSTFYDNWQQYHDHLKEAIAPLTAAQLELRAAPGLRSVGQLAAHVIGARVGWFHGFLGEGDAAVAALDAWDAPNAPTQPAAALVAGLDRSWHLMADLLAGWSAADMQKTFPQEWRGHQYELSRSWVVWHLLEHDLHHGGEISLTLGLHGLPAPDV